MPASRNLQHGLFRNPDSVHIPGHPPFPHIPGFLSSNQRRSVRNSGNLFFRAFRSPGYIHNIQ